MELVFIFLTIFLVLVVVFFFGALWLDLIHPSNIQIQMFGIQLSLFGIVILLAYSDLSGFGFFIGIIGLVMGVFGAFKENKAESKDAVKL